MRRSLSSSHRKSFARTARGYLCLYFLTILVFSACITACAGSYIDEDEFFSYRRFILNRNVVDNIPADGKVQRLLNSFVVSFRDGLDAISDGRLKEAKKDLLKARDTWPEYFGVDFLLARIYEDHGDYATAARYYKSYLNKLKILRTGGYRISGPLISGFTAYGIEEYDLAHGLVEKRLAYYGIDLGTVRPVFTPPGFVLPFLLIIVAAGVYVMIYRWLLPYVRRKRRVNNPPEGFWVCGYCDTANPELRRECERCGRPRVKSHE